MRGAWRGAAAWVRVPAAAARSTTHPNAEAMTENDVEIIEKRTLYQGYFRIDSYRLRHRLHAGGWSDAIDRELFERGHVAAVLPYDPVADTVVLLEQFRVGAYVAGLPSWQIEIVAGIIEAGETVEAVARRESAEEAGCEILELAPICRYLVSPGGATETVMLYCGRVDSRGLGGIHGLKHEHEDIRVDVVPYEQARDWLDRGRIGNALTLIALQWLALHRDELRGRWLAAPAGGR